MSGIITEPSICIPRTLANVTWKDVKDVFEKLIGPGTVERVDLVKGREQHGQTSQFCRIFVHFRTWPVHRPEIANVRTRLLNGEMLKIVYDNPWFWKCVKSNVDKPERNRERSEPFIMDNQPQLIACARMPRNKDFESPVQCPLHTRCTEFKSPLPTRVNLETPPGAPQKDSTNNRWGDRCDGESDEETES